MMHVRMDTHVVSFGWINMCTVLRRHSAHLECMDGIPAGIVSNKGANFTNKGLITPNSFKGLQIVRRAIIVRD